MTSLVGVFTNLISGALSNQTVSLDGTPVNLNISNTFGNRTIETFQQETNFNDSEGL